MTDKDKYYQKEQYIIGRKIADEVVLVPIRDNVAELNRSWVLNDIGGYIWNLIDGRRDAGQMRDAITKEFGITPKRAEKDLVYFLRQLERLNLIRRI